MQNEKPVSSKWSRYRPLAVLVLIAFLAASVLYHQSERESYAWMHYFMGFFLCQFAMLKFFNISQFAEGFKKYDFLAKKSNFYAHFYPYIELFLGLAYLGFYAPMLIYTITLIVMTIGAISVIGALSQGLDVRCACMGTILNVPLSTVTLTEDLVMIGLSAYMMVTTPL